MLGVDYSTPTSGKAIVKNGGLNFEIFFKLLPIKHQARVSFAQRRYVLMASDTFAGDLRERRYDRFC